jgi:hypothetical protein
LPSVGGIRYGFWVTDHSGLEDQFACSGFVSAKALSFDDGPILELKQHLWGVIVPACRAIDGCHDFEIVKIFCSSSYGAAIFGMNAQVRRRENEAEENSGTSL